MKVHAYEIHCPECGELRRNLTAAPKICPECGNDQVIALDAIEPFAAPQPRSEPTQFTQSFWDNWERELN